ncbi:MAG TPA: peptidase S8 [Cytophagales bacterium]|nr:peptidase S8 [Cytophagales bacterium]HAA23263.1 peptidase S8 [Cytophagales bacterium]HAP62549.1 peptidase S8 [Cytophagales bacterium]
MPDNNELLKIAISFRGANNDLGLTKFPARMRADLIQEFKPNPQKVSQTIVALQEKGFEITGSGDLTMSVRGYKENFEQHFGTQLELREYSSDAGLVTEDSFYYPPDEANWNADHFLKEFIDEPYIQWPHILMGQRFPSVRPSLFPPRVDYHHLRVPGDVVLTLNAAKVHKEGITGKGVRVAMIDTGFNFDHPYFQEGGFNATSILAPGATDPELDNNGHGTAESANLLAVAPGVSFIGVKLSNETNPRASASILEGFQEALSHNPKIITVSMGYDLALKNAQRSHLTSLPNTYKALEAEIVNAVSKGIIVIFAAGNGHVAFPGRMPEVLSIGGAYVQENGTVRASDYASSFLSKIYPGRRVPDFSGLVGLARNNAQYLMLPLQPGCKIDRNDSDGTGQDDGWAVISGTSAAAPQIAGVCALLLEKDPHLTSTDLRSILRRTSLNVTLGEGSSASNGGVAIPETSTLNGPTGAGLVDAYAALRQL